MAKRLTFSLHSKTWKTFLERSYRNMFLLAAFPGRQFSFYETFTFHYVDISLVLTLIKYQYSAEQHHTFLPTGRCVTFLIWPILPANYFPQGEPNNWLLNYENNKKIRIFQSLFASNYRANEESKK